VRRLRRLAAAAAPVDGDAVPVALLPELAVREVRDRRPDLVLERARAELREHVRGVRRRLGPHAAAQLGRELRAGRAIGGVVRQRVEPRVERVVLRDVDERARVRRRERLAEQLALLEQLARVVRGGVARVARIALERSRRGDVRRPREQPRMEHQRWRARELGGDVAVQRVAQPAASRGRDDRQVPEQLAQARAHRRVVHAVAKPAAAVDHARGALDLLALGVPAVEHELVILVPHLRVACERLVVEIDRDRLGREQRHRDLVGVGAVAVDVGVARDALPAVRAHDVRHELVAMRLGRGVGLVEPARLRDADRAALLDAREHVEQRDLLRARQLPCERAVARMLEEHDARRRRHDRERAREVRLADRRGQVGERLERHERPDRLDRRVADQAGAQRLGELGRRREDPPLAGDPGPREHARQRGLGEAAPHRPRRAVVARPEQRPPIVALVVLAARQRERADHDQRIVAEPAVLRRLGELRRPRRVVLEHRARQRVGLAAHELAELEHEVIGDAIEPGLEVVRLLVLVDVERRGVAAAERRRPVRALDRVRLDADVRRRHRLGVRPHREPAVAVKRAACFRLDPIPWLAHGGSLRHAPSCVGSRSAGTTDAGQLATIDAGRTIAMSCPAKSSPERGSYAVLQHERLWRSILRRSASLFPRACDRSASGLASRVGYRVKLGKVRHGDAHAGKHYRRNFHHEPGLGSTHILPLREHSIYDLDRGTGWYAVDDQADRAPRGKMPPL
jgi:hypothetical protein